MTMLVVGFRLIDTLNQVQGDGFANCETCSNGLRPAELLASQAFNDLCVGYRVKNLR